MTMQYAGSEVLQMAVEIEVKGKAFYDLVVAAVKDEKTKQIFQFLADEEVRHKEVFTKMLKEIEIPSETSPYDNSEVTRYFRSLIDQKIFPGEEDISQLKVDVSDPAAALRVALSLEKDAVLFFSELLNTTQLRDEAVVNQIIDEERDHIRRIIQLKSELGV